MNPCDRADSLLSFFVEHECSPAEARFVEGHLVACARCRRQRDELTLVMRRLKLLPAVEVSSGFTERVLDEALGRPAAGLEEELVPTAAPAWKNWAPPLAAAAALVVAAYFGIDRIETPGNPEAQDPVATVGQMATPQETFSAQPIDVGFETTGSKVTGAASAGHDVQSMVDLDPSLGTEVDPTPLGTRYVLEDWVLREPAGGGQPVLTRVGASKDDRLVVTF